MSADAPVEEKTEGGPEEVKEAEKPGAADATTEQAEDDPRGCCEKWCGFDQKYWDNSWPQIWLPKWIGINLFESHPDVDMVDYNERSCTDCPCLLVFWVGIFIQISSLLYFMAPVEQGGMGAEITTLFRGTDYNKNICMCDTANADNTKLPGYEHNYMKGDTFWEYDNGSDDLVERTVNKVSFNPCLRGNPYAAFPDPRTPNLMLCLSNCSQTTTDPRMIGFIPTNKQEIKLLSTQAFQEDDSGTWNLARRYGYPTKMAMTSYCIPDYKKFTGIAQLLNDTAASLGSIVAVIENIFGGAVESMTRAMGDLIIARYVLYSAAGVALIGAFGYMWIIRTFGDIIVIVAMVGTAVGGAFLAYTLFEKSQTALEWGFIMMYQIMYYGSIIIMIGVLFIVMTIFGMWDNIMKAVEIAKESSRAVQDMAQVLLVPFVNAFMIMGYIVFWMIVFFAAMAVAPTENKPLPMVYWPPNFCSYPGMAIKSALYSAGEYNAMLACSRLFNGNQCFWDVNKKRCEAGTVNKYVALTHRSLLNDDPKFGGTICETFSRGKAGNTDLSASRAKSLCDGQYSRQCFWDEAHKKCKSKCPLRWYTNPPGHKTNILVSTNDYADSERWTTADSLTTSGKSDGLTNGIHNVAFKLAKKIDLRGNVIINETLKVGGNDGSMAAEVGDVRQCSGSVQDACRGSTCRSELGIERDEWAYYETRQADITEDSVREQPYMNYTQYGCSDLRCAFERHAIQDPNVEERRCFEAFDGTFWVRCPTHKNENSDVEILTGGKEGCLVSVGGGDANAKVREVPCYSAVLGGGAQQLFLFCHFFLLLWAVNFIDYMSYSAKSGAFAAWYFSDWDPDRTTRKIQGGWDALGDYDKDLYDGSEEKGKGANGRCRKGYGYFPVIRSFMRNIRFHMGTNAFAGCLIAILQTMQLILLYVQYKCKDADHPALQYALLCASWCLSCMKDCFDKMNQGALIFCQIYAKPFLSAGLSAFTTQVKHLGTSILMIMVSTYITKIGIVCITAFTAGVALMICQFHPALKELSSYVLVCVVCAMIGFVVAQIFMSIYQSAIDTIYLCFLVDMDHHNDVPQHASQSFTGIYTKQKEDSKDLAETDGMVQGIIENAEQNAEEYKEEADAASKGDVEMAETPTEKA